MDLAKIKEFVDEGLLNGIICKSESPWSVPIVLASKADGGTCVCIDYRARRQPFRRAMDTMSGSSCPLAYRMDLEDFRSASTGF